MAYNDIFQENRVAWAKPFERTYKGPLDRSSMFSSYADALEYAKQTKLDSREIGGTSYVGQIVTVYGASQDGVTQEVAAYIITAVGEGAALQRLAQTTSSGDFAHDIQRLETAISDIWEAINALRADMGALADSDTTYTFSAAVTTDGAILVTTHKPDGTTESQEVQVKGWQSLVETASGKTNAHVYDSNEDQVFLTDISTKDLFKVGDLIYFKAEDQADLWVTAVFDTAEGDPLSYYEFAELEVEHPDLTGYMLTKDADAKYATKVELNTEKNNLTAAINGVKETVQGHTTDIAENKAAAEQAIADVQAQITAITGSTDESGVVTLGTIDHKVAAAINDLDVALAGETSAASKTYVKAIKQTDGKIEASIGVLPDYTDVYEAKGAAEQALTAAQTYVDTKVGDLGESADVVTHIGTVISAVNTNITGVTNRVTAVENTVSDQGTRLASAESTITSQGTKITNIETEVSTLKGRVATVENTAVTKVIVGTEELEVKDNTVTISKISTDLLVNGTLPLILDCGNAAQK